MRDLLDTTLITIGLVVCVVFWFAALLVSVVPLVLAAIGYAGYELADFQIDTRRLLRALKRGKV